MNLSIFRDKYRRNVDNGEVYCFCDPKYKDGLHQRVLSEDFCSLFIEKNSDGTRNLRLKGNELYMRIRRRINSSDMPLIIKLMRKYPTLVKLDLAYNRIDNTGLITLCDEYLKFPNPLEVLILTGCDIECAGISSLCACAQTLKLKILKLTANKFGADCGFEFYTLLSNSRTLEILDVDSTGQDVSSFPHFMSAIRLDCGMNESLKVLDISDVIPLSQCLQAQPGFLADQLSNMFSLNNTLKELHIQKCGIDGHAVECMLKGMKYNTTLTLLDLGYNKVGNFGAEKLTEWFMTSPSLLGINLAGNSIGEIGGRALSFGLPYSKLRLLDLSQNKITDVAMCGILLSIKKVHKMRVLYIFGNEIGPLSMEILERQIAAGIHEQANIDFQLFRTPEGLHVSKCGANDYKHISFSQLEHADVQELRIRHNKLRGAWCQDHAKVNFAYYHRVERPPCDVDAQYEPRPEDDEKLRERCAEKERLAALRSEEESDVSSQYGVAEESTDSCIIQEEEGSVRQIIAQMPAKLSFGRDEAIKEAEKDSVSEVEVFIETSNIKEDDSRSQNSVHIGTADAIEKRLSLMVNTTSG